MSETTPRTFAMLLALADATPPWLPPPPTEPGHPSADPTQPTDRDVDLFTDRQIAEALKVDVLGRLPDGSIKCFSEFLHRTVVVESVSRLKYPDLLLHFGTPVRGAVTRIDEGDGVPNMFPVSAVREALAHLASETMLEESVIMKGIGIWGGEAPAAGADSGDDTILLVNPSEGAALNGTLSKLTHPRHGPHLLSFESGARPWYDFDQLSAMLAAAESPAWRSAIVDDLWKLFARWRWQGTGDPMIVSALIFTTWVQSLWAWRPRIDVLGGTNTGKSMLCGALSGIFHNLCILTSDTTAAGLRQKIANRMMICLVDEVDAKNKTKLARQREILEMLRSASRGTVTLRGSGGSQKSVEFTLRHLVWVAGITVSYDDAADRNRAIILNLLPPVPEMRGKLSLPPAAELADLGQRSLAAALWAARRARTLAMSLKDHKVQGVDQRLIESYAVPAAMLATVLADDTCACALIESMVASDAGAAPIESDESSLVADILAANVRAGAGETLSVGQILECLIDDKHRHYNQRAIWETALDRCGIKRGIFGYGDGVPEKLCDKWALIMNCRTVCTALLRGTRHEGQPIGQHLARIDCSIRGITTRRVGGVACRPIMFPFEEFVERFMGRTDGEPQPTAKQMGF